jgi:hypothetical protein
VPEPRESVIKAALTAAKDLGDLRDARLPAATPEEVAVRAELGALRREADRLLSTCLANTGCDFGELDVLQERATEAVERILKEHRVAGSRRRASARETMRRAIDSRRAVLDHLIAAVPGTAPEYVALDAPFLIWPTLGIELQDSLIEPWNSWAKFDLWAQNSGGSVLSGRGEVVFYFLWENPNDQTAYVDVDGFLVLDGVCSAAAHGGTFPGDRYARVRTDATLRLMEWWNQPPTEPLPQTDQVQRASTISLDAGGWFDYQNFFLDDVFRGFDLRYELFAVPAHAAAVFEVACSISYELEDGLVYVYMFNDTQLTCPYLQIKIRRDGALQ